MTVRSPRGAAACVWTVWAVMFVAALGAIAVSGRNIPFAEDWELVAPLTGNEPDLLTWLWAQNNEHRLPVPRLVGLAVLTVTGDYRAGMVLNASALGAIAAGMILVARRLRGGRTNYADAFFPLTLMHLGHWDNIVWSWQMQFVLATALTCGLLLAVVAYERALGAAASIAACMALIALPLTGGTGLAFVPPLALWLTLAGLRRWQTLDAVAPGRWSGAVLLGSAAVTLVVLGLYFVGWERPPWNPPSPGLGATLAFGARFTAFGFGPAAGLSWRLSALVAGGVLLASAVVLVVGAARAERSERLRAAGLILFGAGAVVLALAIGSGRAGRGSMSPRYALLGVPVFCAAYFVWELYGPPTLRSVARAAFLLIALVALPFNVQAGLERRDWFGRGFQAFERDLAANLPRSALAARHHAFLYFNEAGLSSKMQMLQRAGFGPFARIRDDEAAPVSETFR